jgi:putative heme iron utilization protein
MYRSFSRQFAPSTLTGIKSRLANYSFRFQGPAMVQKAASPIRPTDDSARTLARALMEGARFGALGVLDPISGAPLVSRIAVGEDEAGQPLTLISELSHHTKALRAGPAASLLLGEPGPKGDPLTHPRITLQVIAEFVAQGSEDHMALRALYLAQHPKAQLYIDFGDFHLVRLAVTTAFLNGGFGKAFTLTATDLIR